MSHQVRRELLFCSLFVALGTAVRLTFRDVPNFAPIAGLALFSGYFFCRRATALLVPLLAMAASDLFLGAYSWQMMALVYGMLALPAVGGPFLRSHLRFDGSLAGAARSGTAALTCGLAASLAFFVVTNFGAWLWFDSYAKSWSGLANCYAAALPFFRYTVAGDLLFTTALFGIYAAAKQFARQADTLQRTQVVRP